MCVLKAVTERLRGEKRETCFDADAEVRVVEVSGDDGVREEADPSNASQWSLAREQDRGRHGGRITGRDRTLMAEVARDLGG